MISFSRFELPNGLRVLHHEDKSTPMVAMNIIYDVGSKDENPDKTGFAHLFEHLMFGGSANIPSYDDPLQFAGGENNAWTSSDITNFYLTIPAINIETGFWLESDRMLKLAFSEESLVTQKKVVVEEFKESYLNQPYGDASLLYLPLVYKKHSYNWPTIGKNVAHIEGATLDDVKAFYYDHYAPNNAILAVTGNISLEKTKELCNKWFAPIEKRTIKPRNIPVEPSQTKAESLKVERDVPHNTIYKVYHMCSRVDNDYYATDLISDILSNGNSSRLFQKLVKEKPLFSEINAYIAGTNDPGLFHITGNLHDGVSFEEAEQNIQKELDILIAEKVKQEELDKVRNKLEASYIFGNMSYLNKAMNLANFELLGNANLVNTEMEAYHKVSAEDIQRISKHIFAPSNCSTLYYQSNAKKDA